jgi:hypothetical protein
MKILSFVDQGTNYIKCGFRVYSKQWFSLASDRDGESGFILFYILIFILPFMSVLENQAQDIFKSLLQM